MRKRLLAAALVMMMVLAVLAACASKDEKAETKDTTEVKNVEETKEDAPVESAKVILNEVAHSIFYAPMYVAIEEGYFEEEGIELELVTGFGADKTMTAVISGSADIGFMGSEASIYTYNEGANDYVVNFAQLTQRAGNFLVAREEMPDCTWEDINGQTVLGGRKGGMPEMVFELISVQLQQLLQRKRETLRLNLNRERQVLRKRGKVTSLLLLVRTADMFHIPHSRQSKAISRIIRKLSRDLPMRFRRGWIMCRHIPRKRSQRS